MKENNDFERNDLEIEWDMQIDDDDPHKIIAYVEIWCDIKRKFGLSLEENAVLDMYAAYNPFDDTLKLDCVIDYDDDDIENERFEYVPTDNEKQLIKDMIAEKIKYVHGQTPQEFCDEPVQDESEITIGGIQ